jgi:hypothetical protein
MKTTKPHLILAAVVIILCISVVGNTNLPAPVEQRVIGEPPETGLIGQPNPALAGIDKLYVVIEPPGSEPNRDGLVWSELEKSVGHRIEKETGIKIAEDDIGRISPDVARLLKRRSVSAAHLRFRSINIPELRVDIDMLKLQGPQQYVFRIQTSLASKVLLARNSSNFLRAGVWNTQPTMRATSIRSMPDRVTDAVMKQIDEFMLAYLAANSQLAETPDAGHMGTAIRNDLPKPPPTLSATKFKYVASKNSKVFHILSCEWAQRIKPENLQGFGTRAGAIRAGKRPCKRCSP